MVSSSSMAVLEFEFTIPDMPFTEYREEDNPYLQEIISFSTMVDSSKIFIKASPGSLVITVKILFDEVLLASFASSK